MNSIENIVISKKITVNAPIDLVWHAWTISERVSQWFAAKSIVEARIDGPYELYFNPADTNTMNTKGCKISKISKEEELEFSWKGPDHFAAVMNKEDELTKVNVSFKKVGDQTEITVIHTGWKSDPEWTEAIDWHKMAWDGVLSSLKSNIENGQGDLCCKPN